MVVTINLIRVDFVASPPTVTFLQGRNMDIPSIRNTLRQIEETPEGREQEYNMYWCIATASGNEQFGIDMQAMTVKIRPPFVILFEAGATPFQTSNGNLLGTFVESPGAIVQINNAVGSIGVIGELTLAEIEASTVLAKQTEVIRALGLAQENQYIDNTEYTGGKMTSMRLRIYNNAANVSSATGVIATYVITQQYTGEELDWYKVVKS